MSDLLFTRRGKKTYHSVLVADITLGAAATTIDLTGLNILKGEVYTLVLTCIVNGATNISLYANADTTAANYYTQRMDANSTTIGATRSAGPFILQYGTAAHSLAITEVVYTEDGYYTVATQGLRNYNLAANQRIENFYGGSVGTHASLTRLQIVSSAANAMQSGTRVQLYREAK